MYLPGTPGDRLADLRSSKGWNQKELAIQRTQDNRPLSLYSNSKEHIVSSELESILAQIKSIIKNKKPYLMIKNLPDLHKKFNLIYNSILEQKAEPVKQVIEQDKQAVLAAIKGKPYEKKYCTRVQEDFLELERRVDATNDISDMLGFKDKADSKRTAYFNLIDNETDAAAVLESSAKAAHDYAVRETDGYYKDITEKIPEEKPNQVKQVVNIMARSLVADWRIETDDLERCLNDMREQVKKQIKENQVIKIQF